MMNKKAGIEFTGVNQRTLFKRETLVKKLTSVVEKIPLADLPATIRAIYAFGGILRDKERLHDIDVFCLFSQNQEQSQRWDKFRERFNDLSHGGQKSPIDELWHLLKPYYDKEVALTRAVQSGELHKALIAKGIEPEWVGCFSWTDILNNPMGFFYPFIENVLKGLLTKDIRNITFIFTPYDDFIEGKYGYSHFNCVLAWSPEKPDIEVNLFSRTSEEKRKFMFAELQKFTEIITGSIAKYTEIKRELVQMPLKLNFGALEERHVDITYDSKETYGELVAKCEMARNEMRRYDEEIAALNTVKSALSRLIKSEEVSQIENPIEEQVARLTLEWQPKYVVKERRIREILKILGLPEERVKSTKHPGSKTYYRLVNT